jgi:hypothetical protein
MRGISSESATAGRRQDLADAGELPVFDQGAGKRGCRCACGQDGELAAAHLDVADGDGADAVAV